MLLGHAVELTFDDAAEARCQKAWAAVDGGLALAGMGARPHISLAVFGPTTDADVLVRGVESMSRTTDPIDVEFDRVDSFSGGVIFLAPKPNPALTELHRRFHASLGSHNLKADDLYRPSAWVPHSTVAMDVHPDVVGQAIESASRAGSFGVATLVGASVVEFRPVTELATFPLKLVERP